MIKNISWISRAKISDTLKMPFISASVQAGFPSPADDYIDRNLDLNELLIDHPAATFFMKVSGDSMKDAGIHHGNILIIDRSETPKSGSIIIAAIDGELTVKRLLKDTTGLYLVPENFQYKAIRVAEESNFEIWGVVIHVINTVK
jgi:DNA polymerase V